MTKKPGRVKSDKWRRMRRMRKLVMEWDGAKVEGGDEG